MLFRPARIIGFYIGLVVLWQLLASSGLWAEYSFPPPTKVANELWRYTENGLIFEAVQISMRRLLIGYTISLFIGVAIGIAAGTIKVVDETVGTLVLGLQSLPSICWLPLALLWFGLNERAIIFVVLMGSLFAVSISARTGVQHIPPLYRRAALTMGAGRVQMIRYVLMPAMLPSMAQGLKLGWSFAWRSLMAGELLFVSLGLGHLLNLGRELNNMSLVVAIMLVIIAVGLLVDRLIFARLESYVQDRWGLSQA